MANIKLKTHISYILLASALLSGCHTYQVDQSRRSKIAQFAINHPVAAQVIGVEDKNSTNLTSNAARFATRTGLDDRANGEGRGSMPSVKPYGRPLFPPNSTAKLQPEPAMPI